MRPMQNILASGRERLKMLSGKIGKMNKKEDGERQKVTPGETKFNFIAAMLHGNTTAITLWALSESEANRKKERFVAGKTNFAESFARKLVAHSAVTSTGRERKEPCLLLSLLLLSFSSRPAAKNVR